MPEEKFIELDCPPASPRPDTYLSKVIDGTELEERETVMRLFGNWRWDYSDVPDDVWKEYQEEMYESVEELYNNGKIRYGAVTRLD